MFLQENYLNDLYSFYNGLGKLNFKGISAKKILFLKCNSKNLNRILSDSNMYPELPIVRKYTMIANRIKTNPKAYGITNSAEMALLFMFSVDPSFEAAIIFGESNTTDQARTKMISHFGLYDKALIKLEKFYISNFLGPKKTKEIEEKINRRIYR